MMKRNDIADIREKIFFQNYENLFNVYGTSDGDYFYNILRKVNIPTEIGESHYENYMVKRGDTWTLLAYKFYGDVKLWWMLCVVNNIQNPLEFPTPGTALKVLSNDTVQSVLTAIRSA